MTTFEARNIADNYVRKANIQNYVYDHTEEMHNIDVSMFNLSAFFPQGLRGKVWTVYYCVISKPTSSEVAISVTSGGDLIIIVDDESKKCEALYTL